MWYEHNAIVRDLTLPAWFAAYTTPRHEKSALRHLDVFQIESYLPLNQIRRQWRNGCTVEVAEPLFSGYIFVHTVRPKLGQVLRIPGVLSIVGTKGSPSQLPEDEIESLKSGLHLRKFNLHPYLRIGERARIKSGPLAGMTGVLLREKSNFRIVLSIELIMQSISVEVDVEELEPAGPAVAARPRFPEWIRHQ